MPLRVDCILTSTRDQQQRSAALRHDAYHKQRNLLVGRDVLGTCHLSGMGGYECAGACEPTCLPNYDPTFMRMLAPLRSRQSDRQSNCQSDPPGRTSWCRLCSPSSSSSWRTATPCSCFLRLNRQPCWTACTPGACAVQHHAEDLYGGLWYYQAPKWYSASNMRGRPSSMHGHARMRGSHHTRWHGTPCVMGHHHKHCANPANTNAVPAHKHIARHPDHAVATEGFAWWMGGLTCCTCCSSMPRGMT